MATVMEQYQALQERRREVEAEIQAMGENVFKEGAKALFAAHPEIENFGWTQYTPYWNDGDPCTFGANTDAWSIHVNGAHHDDVWYTDGGLDGSGFTTKEDFAAAAEVVGRFLGQFEEGDLEVFFGDHARIFVTPEAITVSGYDHE